jgi:hypothetical protein
MTPAHKIATCLVRRWTNLYTWGLPPVQRTARQAEIESDLWELEHDPDAARHRSMAVQIVVRLLAGIPDDLAWRMEMSATPHELPVRALAAAGMMTSPRRVSAFGISGTIHVLGISALVWLTSQGYLYWRNPNAAAERQADVWNQVDSDRPFDESQLRPGPDQDDAASTGGGNKFIANLLHNRYSLSVRDGRLGGTGAPLLQSAIDESRFVLLGENHGLAPTPALGSAICNAAGASPFRAIAVEEGPMVAGQLQKWAAEPDGWSSVAAYKSRFPDYLHIYGSPEEFQMLQQCHRAARGGLELWGLQESHDTHTVMPRPEDIRRREALMKTRFAGEYARMAADGGDPRVLLKFGAFHIYRAINPAGGHGIGNYVAEFAARQKTRSLHIRLMAASEKDPRSRYLLAFLKNQLPADWTLFDLRALRPNFNTLVSKESTELATLVFGIDLLVLVPVQ